jgi:hypothetical protein
VTKRALLMLAVVACAHEAYWPSKPAEHPATLAELQAYQLSVYGPTPDERNAFARALASRGFHVVDHEPVVRRQLAVTLTHDPKTLVATIRSDGWWVDDALGASPEEVASVLARSQRIVDFIRNSGLPQQHDIDNH